MPYVTLLEASEIVQRETGIDITIPQLIRAGTVLNLPLCVLLDVKCYSPTHQIRRQKKAEEQDPDYWGKVEPKLGDDLDYAYGCFALPPRHVSAFQTKDTVRIDSVTSLDGNDTYDPGVDISRDELQIMLPHLDKFIAHIKASKSKPEHAASSGTLGSAKPPVTVATPAGWIEQVRAIALEYIAKHKASDLFPSQADVCGHAEKVARERKIYGPQGKPVSNSYIQRNAIQGEWWTKNKP